jgi:hypothetical protein
MCVNEVVKFLILRFVFIVLEEEDWELISELDSVECELEVKCHTQLSYYYYIEFQSEFLKQKTESL